MTARRVLLKGYYGVGNLGDNALALVLARTFTELFADMELAILADRRGRLPDLPKAVKRLYFPVEAVGWRKLGKAALLGWRMVTHDILVMGGGGVLKLEDYWLMHNTYLLTKAIQLLGKRLWVIDVGIEGTPTGETKLFLSNIVRMAEIVSVRDTLSMEVLEDIAGSDIGKKIFLSADPALELVPPDYYQVRTQTNLDLSIGFAPVGSRVQVDVVVNVLRGVLNQFSEAKLLLIPFHLYQDVPVIEEIRAGLLGAGIDGSRVRSLNWSPDPLDYIDMLRNCTVVVGMRLHSLILGSLVGVPLIASGDRRHLMGFCEDAGLTIVEGLDCRSPRSGAILADVIKDAVMKPMDYTVGPDKISVMLERRKQFYEVLRRRG